MVNNPDLAISIVDKAFAFAKVYDSEFITAEHFIEGFEYCDRIYESTREQAIARLRSLDTSILKDLENNKKKGGLYHARINWWTNERFIRTT